MSNRSWVSRATVVPLVGALALATAPQASAMTAYALPAAQQFAGATAAQPVYYRYHRHYGYGAGPAFAFATLGMIAALAASSSYNCDWGSCGDYGYDYGGPYYYGGPVYGGPYYYGGWGGHPHWGHRWGGHAWGGHPGGPHHNFAGPIWLRHHHR